MNITSVVHQLTSHSCTRRSISVPYLHVAFWRTQREHDRVPSCNSESRNSLVALQTFALQLTHSTSRNGNVTVFQKSYPYSHVTLKCSSNSSSISGLYWTVTVFHMKFFCNHFRSINNNYDNSEREFSHGWIFARVFVQTVLPQSAASVQLDVKLVVVSSWSVDVHAIGIIGVTWWLGF